MDYMEDNLLEPISYEDAALYVNYSSYHFHRILSLTIEITVNEYIKRRGLLKA